MFRQLSLTVASTVCTLLLVEAVIRLTGLGVHDTLFAWKTYADILEHDAAGDYMRHPANSSFVSQGVTMRFNSLGMRDQEPRSPKPPGVFRLLCLGDSHTLGPGVEQDAIYPARLRAEVAGPAVDVVAAGVGGWNTVAESRFLAAHIDELAPDLVSLLYVTNDSEPTEAFDPTRPPASPLYVLLVSHSRLFEWGAWLYQSSLPPPDAATAKTWAWLRDHRMTAFAPEQPGWLDSRTALARMLDLTRARGARFVVFLNDQANLSLEHAAWERLSEFGSETGVPIFDTLEFYEGRPIQTTMINPFRDVHQSALGHALLAAGIARTLRSEGLLPR